MFFIIREMIMFRSRLITTYKELFDLVLYCRLFNIIRLTFLTFIVSYVFIEIFKSFSFNLLSFSILTFFSMTFYHLIQHIRFCNNHSAKDLNLPTPIQASVWSLYKVGASEIIDDPLTD